MSKFKPDIFKNLERNGYATDLSVVTDDSTETIKATQAELIAALEKYGKTLTGKEKDLYVYTKLDISTTHNIYASLNILNTFLEFYNRTLVLLYPGLDLQKIYEAQDVLEDTIKNEIKPFDKPDNEYMIPVLAAMLEKMI
jgi:hypothetical protein